MIRATSNRTRVYRFTCQSVYFGLESKSTAEAGSNNINFCNLTYESLAAVWNLI
jgi:hypothetical protein